MSIQERQNQADSIKRLASQRYLYSCAKKTRNVGMSLILLVAILGVVSLVVDHSLLNQLAPLFVIIAWMADQLFLKRMESNLKTEAATIQEEFDCFVLDLPWPEHKGLQRITPERLRQLAQKAESRSDGFEGLADWYSPAAIPCDTIQAKIHCQKLNCWWDSNLRRTWKTVLCASFVMLVVLGFSLAIITGITVAKVVASAASFIRVIAWGFSEVMNQEEAGRHADRILRYLTGLIDQENVLPADIRSAQDEIFEHRRSNPPVPDWLYKWRRDGQEREASEPLGN